jgi:hypothetical protein
MKCVCFAAVALALLDVAIGAEPASSAAEFDIQAFIHAQTNPSYAVAREDSRISAGSLTQVQWRWRFLRGKAL